MKNEIVLITGATAGIGRACAEQFHGRGAKLVLTGRRADRLKELQAHLGPDRVHVAPFDLTDLQACESCLAELPTEFRDITILVNNAGCAIGVEPAWQSDLEEWDRVIDLNVKALVRFTRLVLPGMVERDRGHIINLGSIAGTYPYAGGNVYGASKAFVEQFSHNLRCDLLGHRIRVSNIEPGIVETEFSVIRYRGDKAKADAVYAGVEAMTAEDIAEAVVWAASVPPHVNINRIEMMATMQSAGGLSLHRD